MARGFCIILSPRQRYWNCSWALVWTMDLLFTDKVGDGLGHGSGVALELLVKIAMELLWNY
jgi:hypothetical protein